MDEQLDVVVTGLDVDLRQAETGLTRVFGIELNSARRLLRDLPLVARRGASLAIAERYVAALRSIGARVELRPTGLGLFGPNSDAPLLPAPLPSAIADLQQSLAMERATDSAVALFRASEGLDALETDDGLNLANPAIPRAPAIPHDLARMPNAALPRFSDRPSWRTGAPAGTSLEPGAESLAARPAHVDAQLPPAGSTTAVFERGSFTPPPSSPSVRPGAVGFGPSANNPSSRPGHSPRSNDTSRKRNGVRWPILLLVLLAGLLVLRFTGVIGSSAEQRRLEAWGELGIDAGEHAPASAWLAARNHLLAGSSHEGARELVSKLERAGVPSAFVVRIQSSGQTQVAEALVIEVPTDPNARRTVLALIARARGKGHELEPDHGQRYSILSLR